jgi:hypothetical protein
MAGRSPSISGRPAPLEEAAQGAALRERDGAILGRCEREWVSQLFALRRPGRCVVLDGVLSHVLHWL